MAEDSFKGLVVGSIMALFFVFAILSFAVSTSNSYGKEDPLDEYYDLSGITENLENIQTQSETLRSVASSGGQSQGVFTLVSGFFDGVGAFFSIGFSMFGFIVNLFDFIIIGTLNIIFANPVFTSVVVGLIIIGALFGIFRFLKQGS